MWTQTERMKVSTAVIGKMKMMRNGESWRDSWVERNADDEQDDVRAFYAAPHHRLRGKRKRKTLLNKGKSKKSSMWSKVWTKDKTDGCLIISVSMVTAKALVKHGETSASSRQSNGKKWNGWKRRLAPVIQHGLRKQLEEMAHIWVPNENPET